MEKDNFKVMMHMKNGAHKISVVTYKTLANVVSTVKKYEHYNGMLTIYARINDESILVNDIKEIKVLDSNKHECLAYNLDLCF